MPEMPGSQKPALHEHLALERAHGLVVCLHRTSSDLPSARRARPSSRVACTALGRAPRPPAALRPRFLLQGSSPRFVGDHKVLGEARMTFERNAYSWSVGSCSCAVRRYDSSGRNITTGPETVRTDASSPGESLVTVLADLTSMVGEMPRCARPRRKSRTRPGTSQRGFAPPRRASRRESERRGRGATRHRPSQQSPAPRSRSARPCRRTRRRSADVLRPSARAHAECEARS